MTTVPASPPPAEIHKPPLTSTRVFLRGLAVSLPAVLTVVITFWIIGAVNDSIIQPASRLVQYVVSQLVDDSVPSAGLVHPEAAPPIDHAGTNYVVTEDLRREYYEMKSRSTSPPVPPDAGETPPDWNARQQGLAEWMQSKAMEGTPPRVFIRFGARSVPYPVYAHVAQISPPGQIPQSARGIYMAYAADRYFGSVVFLNLLTILFIVVLLFMLGRFVSVRIGRWIVDKTEEHVLGRLPVVRNVYGSVKQVTDFLFTENQHMEFRRVVAVEYPCKGIWSFGFVTGESLKELAEFQGEPCYAVLIPTSPMPMTGYTVNVPKSSLLDLDFTVEQAMQFCISCGVLTPTHQKLTPELVQKLAEARNGGGVSRTLESAVGNGGRDG